jgi:peptidyl-prolyl cis-trans isomerase SurA
VLKKERPVVRVGRVGSAVLVAALGSSALSACSPSQLGAAAVVDDKRITVTDIQGTLKSVHALQQKYGIAPADNPTAARDEVQRRVVDLVFDKAAKSLGVAVSPGEVSTALANERKQLGGDAGLAQEFARSNLSLNAADEVFRQQLLDQKMLAKITSSNPGLSHDQVTAKLLGNLVDAARAMRIRINPRYGSFDATAGQINPVAFDFLRPSN